MFRSPRTSQSNALSLLAHGLLSAAPNPFARSGGRATVTRKWRAWLPQCLLAIGLAACGGGGSDTNANSPQASSAGSANTNSSATTATGAGGTNTIPPATTGPAAGGSIAPLVSPAPPAQIPPAPPTAASPTTFSVINLAANGTVAGINATGQIAFTTNVGAGRSQAHFYNGTSIQELGTLGGDSSIAQGVNASGQVVGFSNTPDGSQHAFSWTASGGMVDLGTLGGTSAAAQAINASGQVAAVSSSASGLSKAFLLTPGRGLVDLGLDAPAAFAPSDARFVNDAGQVAGFGLANGTIHAFLRSSTGASTGRLVDLGTLPLGLVETRTSFATALNSVGQVAGNSAGNDGRRINAPPPHAFLWSLTGLTTGNMVDLGTLGGPGSSAIALNDSGQVAGTADTADNVGRRQHAFLWAPANGMVDLGTLGGADSSARAMNSSGQVVGGSATPGSLVINRAFVWTAAEGMVDLNTRVPTATAGLVLVDALAISDNGWIVSRSNGGQFGDSRLVLLKPLVGTAAR